MTRVPLRSVTTAVVFPSGRSMIVTRSLLCPALLSSPIAKAPTIESAERPALTAHYNGWFISASVALASLPSADEPPDMRVVLGECRGERIYVEYIACHPEASPAAGFLSGSDRDARCLLAARQWIADPAQRRPPIYAVAAMMARIRCVLTIAQASVSSSVVLCSGTMSASISSLLLSKCPSSGSATQNGIYR